jgi:hypothetical protein
MSNVRTARTTAATNLRTTEDYSCRLTPGPRSSILRLVLILGRRLSALFLTLALAATQAAVCAGWMTTPEARMACCSEGGACPMHKSDSPNSSSAQTVSQAEADSCCAASEGDQSSQSSSTFASTISLAVLGTPSPLPTVADVAVRPARTAAVPLPPGHVPKHVLLSVFLV